MKVRALLFGLNYEGTNCKLRGCINDVHNMESWLKGTLDAKCSVYTDDVNKEDTTGRGMIRRFFEHAMLSFKEDLDLVWIHYSGHGSHIKDQSGDEKDGEDECLVPSDWDKCGLLSDDYINSLFQAFNPKTRVICIFDCCHSGTIGDLKYSWEGPDKALIENIKCKAGTRVITLSGCLDNQYSMDAFNVDGDNKFGGALTGCLLKVLRDGSKKQDVFSILEKTREFLKSGGYEQTAKLCSSYNLSKDPTFIPEDQA